MTSNKRDDQPTDESADGGSPPAETGVDAPAEDPAAPASTPMPGAGPAETVQFGTEPPAPTAAPTPEIPNPTPPPPVPPIALTPSAPPDAPTAPTPDAAPASDPTPQPPPLFSLETLAGDTTAPATSPDGAPASAPADRVAFTPTPLPPVAPIALPTDGSEIVPPTPPEPVASAPVADPEVESAAAAPAPAPAGAEVPTPGVAATAPAVPGQAATEATVAPTPVPGLTLPAAAPPPPAAPSPLSPLMFDAGAAEPARRRRRQRSGSGVGLVLTLLVLAALVAAAFVYGRPYLFPDDWDESVKPFADGVETIRGTTIVEPFTVVTEVGATYEAGFDADYFGDWEDDLPLWRAFGLADGGANAATIGDLVPSRPAAYYSLTDRQVHRLDSTSPEQTEPVTMAATAEAALDQDHRWTLLVDGTSMESDAIVRAVVASEARGIQEQSSYAGTLPAPEPGVPELPAVLDHRLIAPAVYADVLGTPPADEVRMGALEGFAADLGGADELPLGPAAVLADGDVTAGPTVPMDRSFWFLAFASRLPATTAYDLSESLVATSLTPVRTADAATCFAAVFDLPTPEQGFGLATTLNDWVAAAPVETAGVVTGVSETAIQFQVCDPGLSSATTTDGIARALIGYRAAELAVIHAVTERGGGAEQIRAGLELLRQSSVGDELAALPPDGAPALIASEAVTSVVPIVDASTAGLPVAPAAPVEQPATDEQPAVEPGG